MEPKVSPDGSARNERHKRPVVLVGNRIMEETERIRIILFGYRERLAKAIIKYYEKSHQRRAIRGSQNQEDALMLFIDLLGHRLDKFIREYTPVDYDQNYDYFKGAFIGFIRGYYKYVVLDVNRELNRMRKIKDSEVMFPDIEENLFGKITSYGEPSAYLEQHYLQKMAENLFSSFQFHLNSLEKVVFSAMVDGKSYKSLSDSLGTFYSGEQVLEKKLRPIRNLIEYRLICYCGMYDLYSETKLIKGMNLHPSLNWRFFDSKYLSKLPARSELKKIATGAYEKFPKIELDHFHNGELEPEDLRKMVLLFDPKAVEVVAGSFVWKSRKAISGKLHKTYKSYINKYGLIYDHTCDSIGKLNEYGDVIEVRMLSRIGKSNEVA